jgi:hypothetical protein
MHLTTRFCVVYFTILALAQPYSTSANGNMIIKSERILERNYHDLIELIYQNFPGGTE